MEPDGAARDGRALTEDAGPGVLVEACVDSADGAEAAELGGAGRVELCDNLLEGGTTPSAGTIAVARERVRIPLFVLIRPRGGDFLYSDAEMEVMRRDIALAASLGADGVALGALTPDGEVDAERAAERIVCARPLQVTFHRAFDLARDPAAALEALAGLGVDRVLTSGAAPSAVEGAETIAALVRQSAGRVAVLAGGGVTHENTGHLVRATGVREVHVRGAVRVESAMRFRRAGIAFGKPHVPDEYARTVTAADRIRLVVEACAGAAPTGTTSTVGVNR